MRSKAPLTVFLVATLLAAPAVAQQVATLGKPVPDIKVKLNGPGGEKELNYFSNLRGAITVFYFWRPSNLLSVEKYKELHKLAKGYEKKGVHFVAVTAASEEAVKEFQKDNELPEFQETWWQATALYYLLGAFSEPYVSIVGPRGRLLWRGFPGDDLQQRLDDLIERTHPPLGDTDWLERQLRKAGQLLDQREYGKAYTIAYDLYKMTEDRHPLAGKAAALMNKCERAAAKWLKEAIQAEQDRDYEEAARIVAEIAVRFHDPEENKDNKGKSSSNRETEDNIKRKAEQEIGRMNGDRKLKKLIREARKNARGELMLDRAERLAEDGDYLAAKRIYFDVIKKYAKTDAAEEAKDRLRKFKRDREVQAKIAEQRRREQAWRLLDIADHFAKIEFYDEARDTYARLVADFADTLPGKRAQERLAKLPAPKRASAEAAKSADKEP